MTYRSLSRILQHAHSLWPRGVPLCRWTELLKHGQTLPQSGPAFTKSHQLLSLLRQDATRSFATGAFQPSRLYPQRRATPEAAVFWSIVAVNVLATMYCKSESPGVHEFAMTNLRTSVAAIYEGRYHTLLTSIFCHTSAIHCAINLLVLGIFRRTQPLTAIALLQLYLLGGVAGSTTHVVYHWYDAGGGTLGTRYALNTPGFFGCAGGSAAVIAYKMALEPGAIQAVLGFIPMPIALAAIAYFAMEVKEKEYSDGPAAKLAGAAVGAALALLAVLTHRRKPMWK